MKNLKGLIFKATTWHDSTKEVIGEVGLIDHKTLQDPDPKINRNGYLVVIINKEGNHLIQPDTLEINVSNAIVKAQEWDKLDEKISRLYVDENGDELSEEDSEGIDLGTIGEIAASAFGWI